MRLLLDTHTLRWWLAGDQALSDAAREAITDPDNDVFVSAASAWEIATKYRLGRLPGAADRPVTVVAEIKTGKRRVLDYLLSPLHRYSHDVLRER